MSALCRARLGPIPGGRRLGYGLGVEDEPRNAEELDTSGRTAPLTNEAPASERSGVRSRRWDGSGTAGIAFALLFIGGAVVTPGSPHYQAPLREWQDWATDTGTGWSYLVAVYLWTLAAFALVVFVTGLARRIRAVRGAESLAAGIVHGMGLLAAGLLAVGAVAFYSGPVFYLMDDDRTTPPASIEIFAQLNSLGLVLVFLVMALALAVAIAIASVSLRHSLPRWFIIFGYVVAATQPAALLVIPVLLIPIWAIAAGVVLLTRPLDPEPLRTG